VYKARYANPVYFETADRLAEHASEHGLHPASLAVAWVMSHPAITAPIIGARNVEQLEASLSALDIQMTPQWRDEISALSMEPPPATDRSEEREGVVYGGAAG
jgi:aryl-alcohol dehydrogenase-like predicted oxidoreductase